MITIPARWYHVGRTKPVRLIVVHCTVSRESGTGAEAVANYFRRGERRASTHRVCDSNSTVKCVEDGDTAFGAAGVNSDGLHMELVGMPDQTSSQWQDPFGIAMFKEAGVTMREWTAKYAIPFKWLTVAQVADGYTRGFCTHADASKAFPAVSTGHWDPGPGFPKPAAFEIWMPHLPTPIPPPTTGDDEEMAAPSLWKLADQPEVWLVSADMTTKTHVTSQATLGVVKFFMGVRKTQFPNAGYSADIAVADKGTPLYGWLDTLPVN